MSYRPLRSRLTEKPFDPHARHLFHDFSRAGCFGTPKAMQHSTCLRIYPASFGALNGASVCVCVGGRAGTVTRRVPHQILYQLIISETNHPSSKILHWRNFQYCHVSDCSDVTPRTYPPLPYRRYGSATPHDVNTYVTSGKQFSVGYSASPDCEAVQRTLRNATDLLSASHCVKKSAVLPQYISQQVYAYSCVHCRLIQVHYFN